VQFPELFQNWQEVEVFCERKCSYCFEEGNLQPIKGGLTPHKMENLNLKMEVSTCDGLRITTNSAMLNAIPRTLTKLARSWSLLLEEVFSILFLEFF